MSDEAVLQTTLFTNDAGLVIFGDNEFRQLINLPNPFKLVWRTLDDVLGISADFAETILDGSAQSGRFELAQLQIRRREDEPQDIQLESYSAYDSDGKFAGLNLRLRHEHSAASWRSLRNNNAELSRVEHDIVREYFLQQFKILQQTMDAFGGPRFRENLNTVIGSSAAPYKWPVHLHGDDLIIEEDILPAVIYRGLLARGIAYARSALGMSFVTEKLSVLDAKLDETGFALVTRNGLRELYEDLP